MLSINVYAQACSSLANRPTCYSLLKFLWPLVRDHDFSKGDLIIPKPHRREKDSTVYYGHSTIRTTLKALGLKPIHLEDKTKLTIRLDKKAKVHPNKML